MASSRELSETLKGKEWPPRIDAHRAGYEELEGAVKDRDCQIVNVEGGVSSEKGCCCLWKRKGKPEYFRCGTCKFLTKEK